MNFSYILPAALVAFLVFLPSNVLSDASDRTRISHCRSMRNRDKRHHCIAVVSGNANRCRGIRDHDRRYACLAEVSGKRNYCRSIRDSDQRHLCLACVK
jgi:hypothetical protein